MQFHVAASPERFPETKRDGAGRNAEISRRDDGALLLQPGRLLAVKPASLAPSSPQRNGNNSIENPLRPARVSPDKRNSRRQVVGPDAAETVNYLRLRRTEESQVALARNRQNGTTTVTLAAKEILRPSSGREDGGVPEELVEAKMP
ncbi:hypothetical protein PINS_up019980 [Pythium insidiosum]|nr:hypothetical protein PINS_up019980 [Pythium insidiosum]